MNRQTRLSEKEQHELVNLSRKASRLQDSPAVWGQTSPNWRNFLIIKLKYLTKICCTTLRMRFSYAKTGL